MSYQEIRSIFNMLSGAGVFAAFGFYVWQGVQPLEAALAGNLQFWASKMLTFIVVAILARIVLMILFSIVYKIFDREEEFKEDERDKAIELRVNQVSSTLFIFALIAATIVLARGGEAMWFFIVLAFGGLVSEWLSEIVRIIMYKKA